MGMSAAGAAETTRVANVPTVHPITSCTATAVTTLPERHADPSHLLALAPPMRPRPEPAPAPRNGRSRMQIGDRSAEVLKTCATGAELRCRPARGPLRRPADQPHRGARAGGAVRGRRQRRQRRDRRHRPDRLRPGGAPVGRDHRLAQEPHRGRGVLLHRAARLVRRPHRPARQRRRDGTLSFGSASRAGDACATGAADARDRAPRRGAGGQAFAEPNTRTPPPVAVGRMEPSRWRRASVGKGSERETRHVATHSRGRTQPAEIVHVRY